MLIRACRLNRSNIVCVLNETLKARSLLRCGVNNTEIMSFKKLTLALHYALI